MRLKDHEVQGIVNAVAPFYNETFKIFELSLFGSRCDDNKKGGDIDLLILVDQASNVNKLEQEKLKISDAIQKSLGEQRIDITIKERGEINTDPFLKSILHEMILLKSWG